MNSADNLDLEASKSEKKVWLIKVPHFVAKRWHAACQESSTNGNQTGQELGRVVIDPSKPWNQASCSLTLTGPTAAGIPSEYAMRSSRGDVSGLHVFAEEPDLVSVSGRVDQKFDTEMRQSAQGQNSAQLDPEYRKLSRERNRLAATKTRTAQVIAPQSIQAKTSYSQLYANKRKMEGRGEKRIIEKRVRMDKEPLENLLFRLFERQDFWTFQNLVKETDQPVAWLKEVLLELAIQNKSPGRYRDHWQLKAEYRTREAMLENQ